MSKVEENISRIEEELVFEMIELTCGGVDALAKTFTMISQLCEDLENEISEVDFDVPPSEVN